MKRTHSFICWLLLETILGCGHKQPTAKVPAPPELPQSATTIELPQPVAQPPSPNSEPSPEKVADVKPLLTEIGVASWYGSPYHNRRSSNGEVYDMNGMTAAHRTLPLNSIVRVTNLSTRHSAIVRITDRGPFIGERILDLSVAAAKAVDVWAAGTAWVKMEVLETPQPIESGGKWAVQIGAFDSMGAATQMKNELLRRFHPTKVLEFAGPTGDWVRVRVQNDDRELAEQISRSVDTPEGAVFLVRLD
jgi:rare lipoprotein A